MFHTSASHAIFTCFLHLVVVGAFSFITNTCMPRSLRATQEQSVALKMSSLTPSAEAAGLLYQDQQEARLRRALHEQEIMSLRKKPTELKAPCIKVKRSKAGTGFGGGGKKDANMDPRKRLAGEQAKIIHRDGVLRIDNAMTTEVADRLREYILEQQAVAAVETAKNPSLSRAYYGVENSREHRTDLQLSLLRGGTNAGDGSAGDDDGTKQKSHVIADALQELLGEHGTLRPIYENLVSTGGELYEMAAVITNPGSHRQMVHPDLPYKSDAPLYVIFLALQDVNEYLGPTTFLLSTHTAKANAIFNGDLSGQDEQLAKADCRLATLNKGDAVLFDARILHCGNGNDVDKGGTRVLFNFSFRNPAVVGDLGYAGSIRPGYVGAITVGDLSDVLSLYAEENNIDPFAKYGDGIN